eukprot:CAMPEP_0177561406 /NCGR_PEP_ID=MMETSP0369-20130122/71919_1 /TAXON_ID=447022 ORGANISM="Scrippsiella hangoei-like, Strain SHHI-4" /NCGR_SAMPLE_ID=MMETSP0369 /ASSEMBLY_ACC=CAM_ASM_000364 /LENGTH=38 /DNA_ID= /DNA_START= /DNA_END= /DNA_ORIENTATION=
MTRSVLPVFLFALAGTVLLRGSAFVGQRASPPTRGGAV